ncbi:MAG: hypothetical protein ACXWO7_06830 [Candidatus Limnocylindrales bacterium]
MTTERDFDRLARAWLELSPNEAPDRTIDAVLHAIQTTSQVRRPGRWNPRRFPALTRPLLVTGATAVIIVALGAALLLGRGPSSNVGAPSGSPSPDQSPAPSATVAPSQGAGGPLPEQLVHRWIGGTRTVPSIQTGAGTSIKFDATTFEFNQSNSDGHAAMSATASSIDSHTFRLVSTSGDLSCGPAQSGVYGWSLTPDARTLTITAESDACAIRMSAVPGIWHLVGCKDPKTSCLGDVAAGTYGSQYIAPRVKAGGSWTPPYAAVTYTVPDGWANSSDWPSTFGLTPSSDYALVPVGSDEGDRSIRLVTQATPESQKTACSGLPDPTVGRTVSAEMTWLRHVPGLITSAPTPITIDGHAGQWLDVRLDPAWKSSCPGGPGPEVDYLLSGVGIVGTAERQRVIVLDLGSGDLIAILADTVKTAPFTAFAAQAMPVIESLTFQ